MVASVLLGTRPPSLPVRTLVRTADLFGITEGTTRTAISRMLAAGELEGDGARYRLAGALLDRHRRQEESRHPPAAERWDGSWWLAVVPPGARPANERAELRRALRNLRLAEWREGLWVRPTNLAVAGRAECEWVRGRLESVRDEELADDLWDLQGWSRRAEGLMKAMRASLPRLARGASDELAPAFVLAAAVVRHQQGDPLLPQALLPHDWPGAGLRRRYEEYEAAFQRVLRDWTRG